MRIPFLGLLVFALLPFVASAQVREVDAALVSAAAAGDADRVKRLLREGASPNARDTQSRPAVVAATQGNHVEAARALIAAGADVNAQDSIRDSAFLLAGARGYLEILRLTLAAGADLKSTNRFGGMALIPACHYGHVETVRELLGTKIDVDHVNNLGWTALLEAVILGDGGRAHTEIVRLLVAAKANVNIADREGVTPLAHAKRRGYRDIAGILERAGARQLRRSGVIFRPSHIPEDVMAKLRHIAITSKDPWATALFYMEAFGMKKVGETDSHGALGVYLSDGVMNLAILKYKQDAASGPLGKDYYGLHHFGFWVDDIDEAQARTVEAGGKHLMGESKADNSFYEIKYLDPNGIVVDLSANGWGGASKDGTAAAEGPKLSKPELVADRSALKTA